MTGDRPPWWPESEPWPPPHGRRWRGGPWAPAWRGDQRAAFRRGPIVRGFGCLVVLLATLLVSVGVIVLWLLAGLLGMTTIEAPLIAFARPAGLLVLVAGLFALAIGIRSARRVIGPLADLGAAAGRVEAGDFTARVPEQPAGPGELRRVSRAFNAMAARLETEDAARRRLLADVSHELRTPLAVIQGNLEAIVDGVYPADAEHLAPLLEETRVLGTLIDDLRTLSLAEVGALAVHPEQTDLHALLEDVGAAFRARAEVAGAAIRVEAASDLPAAEVDPTRLRQVVSNLVDNALRHAPAGTTIRLRAAAGPSDFELTVTDDGPGIPPDLLPSVFERFTKAPGSRGSGLGLAIARAVVEAHGGQIAANSGPGGRGTEIRISLPRGSAG